MKKIYKNVILGLILATILCFTALGTNYICANTKAIETENSEAEETLPEEIPEEEPKGFIEENWKMLVTTIGGTFTGLSALFVVVAKFMKSTKGVIKTFVEQNGTNDKINTKLTETNDKVDKAVEHAEKASAKTDEIAKKVEDTLNKLAKDNKDEIKGLETSIVKLVEAFKLIVNNSSLLEEGIAKEIDKIIDSKE